MASIGRKNTVTRRWRSGWPKAISTGLDVSDGSETGCTTTMTDSPWATVHGPSRLFDRGRPPALRRYQAIAGTAGIAGWPAAAHCRSTKLRPLTDRIGPQLSGRRPGSAAGGHAGAGGDQYVVHLGHLVDRGARGEPRTGHRRHRRAHQRAD